MKNNGASTVSLLATAVDMVDCIESEVDLRVTASNDNCLNTSTDISHLNSALTEACPSLVGCVYQSVCCGLSLYHIQGDPEKTHSLTLRS